MATRERPTDIGHRRSRRTVSVLGDELRAARLAAGLSQATVGRAADMSHAQVSRLEHGLLRKASLDQLSCLAAALGLDLSVGLFPAGDAVRDTAQLALLERLHRRIHPGLGWQTEVPMPIPGDRRAWDAVIRASDVRIGVEAVTRLRDIQDIERRVSLKQRDSHTNHVILLLANTRANRAARVGAAGRSLLVAFPIEPRRALDALAKGRDPGGSAVIAL